METDDPITTVFGHSENGVGPGVEGDEPTAKPIRRHVWGIRGDHQRRVRRQAQDIGERVAQASAYRRVALGDYLKLCGQPFGPFTVEHQHHTGGPTGCCDVERVAQPRFAKECSLGERAGWAQLGIGLSGHGGFGEHDQRRHWATVARDHHKAVFGAVFGASSGSRYA